MKKTKTPLQAAAASETDEKKTRGFMAAVLGLFGIKGEKADEAAAKMTKTVEKYSEKREKMEETDEEEEEELDGTGSSDGGTGSTDGTGTGSKSEEEEEEEEERAAKGSKAKKAAKPTEEEEEEKAAKALRSVHREAMATADAAYLTVAARYPSLAGSLALRSPSRLLRTARHATGAKGIDAVMSALDGMHGSAQSAQRIKAQADLEARTAKLETDGRKQRVEAVIAKAKDEGRAGALTKAGRNSLRAHGMANGTKALAALVASLPIVARTKAAGALRPRDGDDEIDRSARGDVDKDRIVESFTAGMTPEAAKAWEATYEANLAKVNGASRAPRGG